jgi:predicted ATPase
MITQFRLENFKGHRDTTLALERFTVLVGDNGSGKTSVLEALQLPDALARGAAVPAEVLRWDAKNLTLSAAGFAHDQQWTTSVTLQPPEALAIAPDRGWALSIAGDDEIGRFSDKGLYSQGQVASGQNARTLQRIMQLTGRTALYRFRADQVAASAYSERPGASVAEDGALAAVVLAALKLADDEAFDRIETAMQRIVPSLHRVLIKPASVLHPSNPNPVNGSKLYFDFQGAKGVPAHHASQGTLVVLALLTALHQPTRPSVILLDDFDHALHPRAQMELVRMIKEMLALEDFKETQIIATTHSPYVLDELSPTSVIAFALRDDGSVASKPLSEHPDAARMRGTLKSGELWTLDGERSWVL